jgi:hypothetical protein
MFFQPIQCRLPTDPKHTLYPSQAHPLSVGFQDTFFENLRVASLGFQDPIRSTFFTVILLVATLVCAVLDYIPATTGTTLVDDDLTQHVPYFLLSSLTFQPLPAASLAFVFLFAHLLSLAYSRARSHLDRFPELLTCDQ